MKYSDRHDPAAASFGQSPAMPVLARRAPRVIDASAQVRALLELAECLATRPADVTKAAIEQVQRLCRAGSAGVSLLDAGSNMVHSVAATGWLASFEGARTPLRASPCRAVFVTRAPELLLQAGLRFKGLLDIRPAVDEILVVPLLEDGQPIGSLWVAAHHDNEHRFASDDARLLVDFARIVVSGLRAGRRPEAAPAADAQRLLDSEARFGTIFEITSIGVALADLQSGRLLRVNSRLCRMIDFPEKTLLGHPLVELTHHDDRGDNQLAFMQLVRGDIASFDVEQRLLRRGGGAIWVMTSMNRTPVDPGHSAAAGSMLAVYTDITERKLAEEALAASQQQLRMALDASNLGLWEFEVNGGRTAWSPMSSPLIGGLLRNDFDSIGDDFRKQVHEADIAIVDGALDGARRGQPFQIEYRVVRHDGQVRWLSRQGRVLRDRQGLPLRLIGTVADVTARKTFEEELRRARDDIESSVHTRTLELAHAIASLRTEVLERSNAEQRVRGLLGGLVGAVEDERHRISRELHDTLGQYLSVLTLGLQTACNDAATPPTLRLRLKELERAAQKIEEEVDRLSHELRPLALDEFGLDDALQRHSDEWSSESGISIDLHIHGLSAGGLAPMIESTVYRVAQEALTNVRKHARANHVSLIAERRGGELRLIVEDDGVGFDGADNDPVNGGRGRLGLKGMSERAELVGGQLQIESSPQGGTTIYLTIPLDDNHWISRKANDG